MDPDPPAWTNRSPGDLSMELPEVRASEVDASVVRAGNAFAGWRALTLDERKSALRACRARIEAKRENLAQLIALEVGKPLSEARLELGAVIAKFDLTFADADAHVAEQAVTGGPHPATVRRIPRGVAAVIAPFNFPIHLGHGAAVAYLVAGNPVVFKPSPLAANVGAAYAAEMQAALPEGVFELVQGWGGAGRALCRDPRVRSVCFTGSIPVGTAIARDVAADFSKSLALELGGVNSAIVLDDADLDLAAIAVADGLCLTAGQRCNATTRILLHRDVQAAFEEKLAGAVGAFEPGNPLDESTRLGPLASAAAVDRYRRLATGTDWLVRGGIPETIGGRRGNFVLPAVGRGRGPDEEAFCPLGWIESFGSDGEAAVLQDATPYGLTASIFTSSADRFRALGDRIEVGNLYCNLPTTFSPSTLPFGGLRQSGNGKPGGRGFARFAGGEQAVQWRQAVTR